MRIKYLERPRSADLAFLLFINAKKGEMRVPVCQLWLHISGKYIKEINVFSYAIFSCEAFLLPNSCMKSL